MEKAAHHRTTAEGRHETMGYVGHDAMKALAGDYSWQSNQERYLGDFAWTAPPYGPGTYLPAAAGRNLIGRMPGSPAYTPEGYAGPPIPGFSNGLLPATASYEFLPQNTHLHHVQPKQGFGMPVSPRPFQPYPQPYPVSPIQVLANTWHANKPQGQMDVGTAVKLKFFSSPEGMMYNGLVGDIVAIRATRGKDHDSTFPEHVYDVRCPWRDPRTVKKEALEDKDHGHVLHSAFTADFAFENRRLLGSRPVDLPSMGGFAGQPVEDCPYVILTDIPKEKLEPVKEWEYQQHSGMSHGPMHQGPMHQPHLDHFGHGHGVHHSMQPMPLSIH